MSMYNTLILLTELMMLAMTLHVLGYSGEQIPLAARMMALATDAGLKTLKNKENC